MIHIWLAALVGTGSIVRMALLDFRKAFDLVHHNLLISKLSNFNIKSTVINWVVDFPRGRTQRVKINIVLLNLFTSSCWHPAGNKNWPLAILGDDKVSVKS